MRALGGSLIASAAVLAEYDLGFLELLILAGIGPAIEAWKDLRIHRRKEEEPCDV